MNSDSKIWNLCANLILGIFSIAAILPFILLVVASFTNNQWATTYGFSFFPKAWSTDAYLFIANQWQTIGKAYLMTIVVTLLGTVVSLTITSGFAYALSMKQLPGVGLLNFLVIFTMLFSGGIVATYYCWVSIFQVRDTVWALILPYLLMNGFNVILVKNYYKNNIPESLVEASRIDGANEFLIFGKVVLPLSIPILATVGLMTAIAYWNDWTNGLYFLTQRNGRNLYTIQLVLNGINENISFLSSNASLSAVSQVSLPTTTVRMAIAVFGILPILIAYPFFQKYFVKGITLGGVKE
ncbi:MAG: carbohydrate ABC transporter permease [Lachnospiraceae bacterium]